MKYHPLFSIALGLLCLSASIVPSPGQVIVNPNTLSGTVRLTNSNPAILNLLNPPGNEGFTNLYVVASSVPPAPAISANTGTLPVSDRVTTGYELTVDSADPGIAYAVTPRASMELGQQIYYFNTRTSAPVAIGVPPPALDFDECVGVVTVRFVTSGGAPVPVDGGGIIAVGLATMASTGQSDIPPGVTQQRLYLSGGQTHQLDITIHHGTNFYTDRIEHFFSTNVEVTCDQFDTVTVVVPSAGTLGSITGDVDVIGEFEAVVGSNFDSSPDYSSVVAHYGPFGNQRWDALPGVNFTTPSSGTYVLANVVPSMLDPASPGYAVDVQTLLRSNREVQVFITPGLGWGANPPVPVAPGEVVDLGNTFVIDPGFMSGQVLLKGPAESLGRPSLFRGLLHAGDDDFDGDGLPDFAGTYGIYWSTIAAEGIDRLASGATRTAAHGYSYGDFDGAFNAASSAYEGNYELVVGGLNSEPSIWKRKNLSLLLYSGAVTNDEEYYYNSLSVSDLQTNDVEITAGQTEAVDVNYCFGEVLVRFRATSGTFWAPRIRFSSGTLDGTNFLGEIANYSVYMDVAYGKPDTQADATNTGVVVMYLPEGTYTLNPYITPGDAAEGDTGLQPIDITVRCGQRIAVEPCLQLNLNTPSLSATSLVTITGSVASCTNNVTKIRYTLDGGLEQVICSNCGQNPSFAFNVNLPVECGDHALTVTATDGTGGTSFVTTVLHYDNTPPEITCPPDVFVGCADPDGAVANFTVTATDNCTGPVNIICTPPSGSLFPLGETVVNCIAMDICGNTNACSFKVTINTGAELFIEPPMCTTNFGFFARANATSCDGTLTNLSLRASPLSDPSIRLGYSDIRILIGSRTNLTTAHGLFPEFDGYADHPEYYTDILYTATAIDNQGRVSTRQIIAHYDFTAPILDCPDIIVTAANGSDAVVDFTVTTSIDAILVCNPPSGSVFPLGTNLVSCTARDLCRNTNTCTFNVIVLLPVEDCTLHVEIAQPDPLTLTFTWDCAGTLESAPGVDGPWEDVTDATSPYTAPVLPGNRFFRVRRDSP